jgi:hypothetical protein
MQMNNILKITLLSAMTLTMSGCSVLCMGGSMTCGMSSEERQRLLHPKEYGELWEKPGVTKEEWRQDWVACGGVSGGGFGVYRPAGTSDQEHRKAYTEKLEQLKSCMKEKGYVFVSALKK